MSVGVRCRGGGEGDWEDVMEVGGRAAAVEGFGGRFANVVGGDWARVD